MRNILMMNEINLAGPASGNLFYKLGISRKRQHLNKSRDQIRWSRFDNLTTFKKKINRTKTCFIEILNKNDFFFSLPLAQEWKKGEFNRANSVRRNCSSKVLQFKSPSQQRMQLQHHQLSLQTYNQLFKIANFSKNLGAHFQPTCGASAIKLYGSVMSEYFCYLMLISK